MERIERIQTMEKRMKRALESLELVRNGKDRFAQLMDDMDALSAYYDSDQWIDDYEADERGQLPADLSRGVLSQDGLYNLLTEYDALIDELCNLIEQRN